MDTIEIIEQLEGICDHCKDMIDPCDEECIWGKDVIAIQEAIARLKAGSESIEVKEEVIKVNDSDRKQYENLRRHFNCNVVDTILGEWYYNNAEDVNQCDLQTTIDIREKHNEIKKEAKAYKYLFLIMTMISIILAFK